MELPTPVASRTWRRPTGFREYAARAFARESRSRDDPIEAGEFGWNPRSEIPRITIPSPTGCNRLLRKYPIRSRRRAIRHPASRQENASHQSSAWRASGRVTVRVATRYPVLGVRFFAVPSGGPWHRGEWYARPRGRAYRPTVRW